MGDIDVLVSEVGPRDGLQNTKQFMPTEYKKKWISAAAQAGLREIEVCSFVPPKLIPQMVDAAEVVAHALTIPGLTVAVLAPNLRGAERAMQAGAHKITLTISVSKSHSLSNVRMTPDEAIAEARRVCALRDSLPPGRRPRIESGLSTVFGCTIEGAVSEDDVVRMAIASVEAGCDEVGLADTTGYANPAQIKRVFTKVRAAIGDKLSGAHLHNTRGLGLANVVAALEVGVRTFDSSLGGLGGCPFAPGATGNIVTEDLVFMLESMGLRTGIDLDRLLAVREIVAAGIPGEALYGYVPAAGITKGFVPRGRGEDRMSVRLPLQGIRVVEFVHVVMGPTCGLVLADLGAEVIKVEPLDGDHTRKLTASGAGFFPTFNRNKKSIAVDLKSPAGREVVLKLIGSADAVTENFRPGAMDKLGFGYESLKRIKPELIYCSLKGFLAGPYEHRAGLDETAQMMGGLAYMTGPVGRPLRAGASVNDIMGGMFAAIAILAAVVERRETGRGQYVKSALFENCAFLVGQHMTEGFMTGKPVVPMPDRIRAWAVYDTFRTSDGEMVFVGVVTDTQWKIFCEAFGLHDLLADPSLKTNPQRVEARPRVIPIVTALFAAMTKPELLARCEELGLPFAPITRPEDLFDDPHLKASGGLADITLMNGKKTQVPILPIEMDGRRFRTRLDLPRVGEHTRELLAGLGYSPDEVERLVASGVAHAA